MQFAATSPSSLRRERCSTAGALSCSNAADAGGAVHLGIDNPGAGRDGGVAGSVPPGGDRPPTLQFTCPPPRRWRTSVAASLRTSSCSRTPRPPRPPSLTKANPVAARRAARKSSPRRARRRPISGTRPSGQGGKVARHRILRHQLHLAALCARRWAAQRTGRDRSLSCISSPGSAHFVSPQRPADRTVSELGPIRIEPVHFDTVLGHIRFDTLRPSSVTHLVMLSWVPRMP